MIRIHVPALVVLAAVLALPLGGCAGGWRNGVEPGAAPAQAATAGAATTPQASADAATFTYKGDGGSVAVAGEFNGWNTTADMLTKQPDGSWKLVKKLEPGKYMYKFVVDGSNWKPDPNAAETADDGYGGKNAVVVVGAAGAAPAKAAAAAATPAAAPAASADGVRFAYKGDGNSVAVAGEFNGWNTTADMLTKQPDGSWTLVKKIEPGKYMYKFVVDGSNWKPDPSAAETVDDGYGGKNSVVVVGGAAAAAPAKVAAAPATPAAAPATTGDGVRFSYKGEGGSVAVAGEFNGWNTTADMLAKQPDGSWTLVKKLEPGKYMYKFVVDGSNWKVDPNATETADDGYGGKNSVVVVGGAAGAAPAPAAKAAAPSGKGTAPVASADGVKFTFAGAADQVALAGDFNGWSTTADPLAKQANGTWTVTKKLAAGAYGYKFLVNGKTWKTDDANPESKDDGFGGKNSIVTVR